MKIKSISYSSDRKLARCEKQFSYRYEEQLKPKIKKKGLYMGDWIHQLLEAHYKGEGWEKRFKKLTKTLWDTLFDEERDYYKEEGFTPELVRDLMGHYIEYWSPEEKSWKVLFIEKRFEKITKLGFPLRWQIDMGVQDGKSLIMVERKTGKDIPDSSARILNVQVHSYAFLCGLQGIKFDKILWDYIRTTPTTAPKILKNGSLSERQINTDQRTYLRMLKEAGIKPQNESERQAIQSKVDSLPETLSLERIYNSVNKRVGEMFVRQWIERHKRASLINHPLLTYTKDCKWSCDYFNLCQSDIRKDVDRDLIIKKEFVSTIKELEELK